jgi:aryl-alcohol dehydrogenase-like predicted oxidoreductase
MEYGTIQGVEKPVSRFVLGTMIITDQVEVSDKGGWTHLNRQGSFDLLDAVYEQGCTTFDTAHVYGVAGASERGLGLWMKERDNRDKVVILSKGAIRQSPTAPYRVLPSFIEADIYESLSRLQTDYMDIYMLHGDDRNYPVGPIVEELHKHLVAGRLRAYGGSNWRHTRIQEANDYAASHGLAPFVASEPNFSLAEQVVPPHHWDNTSLGGAKNREARAWYVETQTPVIPYSSLGAGFFSGRLTPGNYDQIKDQLLSYCVKGYCHPINFRRLERAISLAHDKGITVPQVAMAFILQSGLNVFPLTGSRTAQEYADSASALEVTLTPEERAWLDLETECRESHPQEMA